MKFDPETIWLVSGNNMETLEDGSRKLTPDEKKYVVVSVDVGEAYETLASCEPNFVPIGHASLHDFEKIVAEIKASISPDASEGEGVGLPVLMSRSMSDLK